MLFLVCTCIEPMNTLYIVQSGFAVVWWAFGGNRDAGLEARCTGRIHHCHHIRKEAFHIHSASKSPVARLTQKHQHFLCRYRNARDEYLMVRDRKDETWLGSTQEDSENFCIPE